MPTSELQGSLARKAPAAKIRGVVKHTGVGGDAAVFFLGHALATKMNRLKFASHRFPALPVGSELAAAQYSRAAATEFRGDL